MTKRTPFTGDAPLCPLTAVSTVTAGERDYPRGYRAHQENMLSLVYGQGVEDGSAAGSIFKMVLLCY